jgi:hypothetical protein
MAKKVNDEEAVRKFMDGLSHPLKKEIEALRQIILKADPGLKERVKWNAPSYYANSDIVTFNPRDQKRVHLIFHHRDIDSVNSPSFEGDYKGRKMLFVDSMADVKRKSGEITALLKKIVAMDTAKS